MKKGFIVIIGLLAMPMFSQVNDSIARVERTVKVNDPLYREDQFYIGITHSIGLNSPSDYKQNGISPGIQLGILRDIPLNKKRNWALAPGIGFSGYNMRSNLLVINPENTDYEINSNYDKNKQNVYYVEVPLEFRWRSSNRFSHKFWRIYSGIKYSYMISSKSVYHGYYGDLIFKQDKNLNRSQIGAYIVAGFNTWSFQVYYSFVPLYKSGILPENKNIHNFNVGMMFYIL